MRLVALGDWPLRNGKIVGLGPFVLGDEAERIGHIRSLAAPVTPRRFLTSAQAGWSKSGSRTAKILLVSS